MRRFGLAVLLFAVLAGAPVAAADLDLNLDLAGRFVQGGLVTGRTLPGSVVHVGDRPVRVAADGVFVFGFDRDAPPTQSLVATLPDGRRIERTLSVDARRYDIQRIDGLPRNMVTPSEEELARIRREAAAIAAVRRGDSDGSGFRAGFRWPVAGRVTGVYGSQRILNGEPRRPHFGLDIAAPVGTPVGAAAAGVVALAEPDLFFTGGTVMIDHGQGITSVYSHLASVSVAPGATVAAGQPIGTLGASGRATGPHLDWRVSWFDVPLDPALLVEPMAP